MAITTNNQLIESKITINESITKNTSFTSEAIDLTSPIAVVNGKFSIQVAITGDGTASIEYLLSNDGVNYISPTGVSAIATGLTKTTNTIGKDMYSFTPMLSKFMMIKITETGTSDDVTVALTLVAQ